MQPIIWDESANHALNHKYWMARRLISALPSRYREVVVGTCGNYGVALLLACQERGISATAFVPESTPEETLAILRRLSPMVVRAGRTYEHAVAASKRAAAASPLVADGNVDGPWSDVLLAAIAERVRLFIETCGARGRTRIWIPTGNGTTVAGCWAAIAELGSAVQLHAVSSAGNNSITHSISVGSDHHLACAPESITESPDNLPLCNWNALHGVEAMAAIRESAGSAIEVSDGELRTASAYLGRAGIPATPAGAAGFAGFLRDGTSDGYTDIILVTSRRGRHPDTSRNSPGSDGTEREIDCLPGATPGHRNP
ncbi:pyridoxal-phosphate dependent enzyme [Nocardia amamiensis]|uniref:pyridoxal-phosphate dependent enzyme n=1 Tax=Nocardia amamiensis TaxID=404578 RepID=UPI0033E1CE8A